MFKVSSTTLRRVLAIDAVLGLGMGLSHLALSDSLSTWLGLPLAWLQVAAVIVLVAASMAGWLATRHSPPGGGVRLLAMGNLGWVAASLWVALGAGLALTPLGLAWVLLQAAVVFVLAELEWVGARSAPMLATA